jgi:hypothetical protein
MNIEFTKTNSMKIFYERRIDFIVCSFYLPFGSAFIGFNCSIGVNILTHEVEGCNNRMAMFITASGENPNRE